MKFSDNSMHSKHDIVFDFYLELPSTFSALFDQTLKLSLMVAIGDQNFGSHYKQTVGFVQVSVYKCTLTTTKGWLPSTVTTS